jgi:hypothetical protein
MPLLITFTKLRKEKESPESSIATNKRETKRLEQDEQPNKTKTQQTKQTHNFLLLRHLLLLLPLCFYIASVAAFGSQDLGLRTSTHAHTHATSDFIYKIGQYFPQKSAKLLKFTLGEKQKKIHTKFF